VIDDGVADGKAGLERRLGDVGMCGGRDGQGGEQVCGEGGA
jgi:hypothetical protein